MTASKRTIRQTKGREKMKDKLQLAMTLIGLGIGIGALLVLILQQLGFQPREIGVGPVTYEIPTSQPQIPVTVPTIDMATSEPQAPNLHSLGTLRLFGNSNQGLQVQIPESGIYRFVYREGSYSTYPVGFAPPETDTWLTSVLIFRGDKALWDGPRIKHERTFLRLADTKYWASAEEAEKAAQGQYVEAQLNQGDILTLIGVDHFDAYTDNPGQVIIEWFLVSH
jgi:hypothetical protein